MTMLFRTLLIALLLTSPAFAQRGDRDGHVMKEVWRDMDVPESPVLSSDQAMGRFKIAPGFRLELVASEPMIEDPVAIGVRTGHRTSVADTVSVWRY